MANPTSAFGWQMPTNTDLVKDLPADFEVFGQAVDTSLADLKGGTTGQVLSKASNTDMDFTWVADASGIPATIFDAKGDIIAATANDTASRLAVGANNTVLTADSTTATGLKWANPSVNANWSLLNSGGTALTGAATVTVSGISGADKIMIIVDNAQSNANSAFITIRLNADSGTNYNEFGSAQQFPSTYSAAAVGLKIRAVNNNRITMGRLNATNSNSTLAGYCLLSGCNSSGVKIFNAVGGVNDASGTDYRSHQTGGYYSGSATISSISIFDATGSLVGGTVYVYTSA